MPLTQFADTEGRFLFSPSCCSAGSCQLIVVGLLKPFSLRWVGADFCSAPLLECCSVFRIYSPSSMSSIPSSSPSRGLLGLIPCFQSATLGLEQRIEGCVFSAPPTTLHHGLSLVHLLSTTMGTAGAAVGCPPKPPFLQGTQALLLQSLPTGKCCHPWQSLPCAGLAALAPSLPWVLSQAWPNKHWAGGGKTPALPFSCGQAAAAALSSARARRWLVLRSLFAARTLGLFWELLSPTTSLFTHLIGHFSTCNIPTG